VRGNSVTLTFAWNTTSVVNSTYTISAVADAVPSETDTSDNTSTDSGVLVTWLGDLNGDYRIDEDDR